MGIKQAGREKAKSYGTKGALLFGGADLISGLSDGLPLGTIASDAGVGSLGGGVLGAGVGALTDDKRPNKARDHALKGGIIGAGAGVGTGLLTGSSRRALGLGAQMGAAGAGLGGLIGAMRKEKTANKLTEEGYNKLQRRNAAIGATSGGLVGGLGGKVIGDTISPGGNIGLIGAGLGGLGGAALGGYDWRNNRTPKKAKQLENRASGNPLFRDSLMDKMSPGFAESKKEQALKTISSFNRKGQKEKQGGLSMDALDKYLMIKEANERAGLSRRQRGAGLARGARQHKGSLIGGAAGAALGAAGTAGTQSPALTAAGSLLGATAGVGMGSYFDRGEKRELAGALTGGAAGGLAGGSLGQAAGVNPNVARALGVVGGSTVGERLAGRTREKQASALYLDGLEKVAYATGIDPETLNEGLIMYQDDLVKEAQVQQLKAEYGPEDLQKIASANPELAGIIAETEENQENEDLAKIAQFIDELSEEEASGILEQLG